MTYMDSQTIRGNGSAVANTESSLGVINIASGQRWKLFSTWVGTAGGGGGTYRWSISTYPQAEFAFVQEGLADVSIATATADTHATMSRQVSLAQHVSRILPKVAPQIRVISWQNQRKDHANAP